MPSIFRGDLGYGQQRRSTRFAWARACGIYNYARAGGVNDYLRERSVSQVLAVVGLHGVAISCAGKYYIGDLGDELGRIFMDFFPRPTTVTGSYDDQTVLLVIHHLQNRH